MSTHKYLDTTGLGQVWGKIKDLIPESDVFWINVTSTTVNDVTTYSADKTFAEVTAARTAGKQCVLVKDSRIYSLESVSSTKYVFVSHLLSFIPTAAIRRIFYTTINFNNDDTIELRESPFFSAEGSNNAYPLRTMIAPVNGNANTTYITGNIDYSNTANKAYNTGDLFWLNNRVLARAITDIASGATLTENTNYVKTTIENEIKRIESISVIDVSFNNPSSISEAIVGTTVVGDDNLETETLYQTIYDGYSNDALIYFHYYNYFGQASKNSDNSFSAICFKSNDLDNTEGIKIIYKSDGTISYSRFYIPVPEDDINVLNLLSSYGFVSPISDASGNVIVDADNNLILG